MIDATLNLGRIHDAIADAVPEREALVYRDLRLSWRQLADRTRRLANLLHSHGLGCHTQRSELENWESGQDHVGLYLYNGNEYLEGMLGAFKARAAPFNVNYRYIDKELIYLFDDADARAVIFHACFAPTLSRIQDKLPKVKLWIQVADDSDEPLLPGAMDYEQALLCAEATPPAVEPSPDDLYILYTGGTTGTPKGVLWRQEDIFHSALYSVGAEGLEDVVKRALHEGPRVVASSPFMHGAAHWVAFNMWHLGGTVIIQSKVRGLDPDDIWSTVEREGATALSIVGDAHGRPLAAALRSGNYDLSRLSQLSSGGAILSDEVKEEFLELLPGIRILDALGSSEAGTQASQYLRSGSSPRAGHFVMKPGNVVLKEDLSGVAQSGATEVGWVARSGCVPLGYYKDPAKTSETFPTVDGTRFAVAGDRAIVDADGTLRLLGRDCASINTGGEKVFAEEVEQALKLHPDVYDAIVVGTPHAHWGQQVTVLVEPREGADLLEADLKRAARAHLASYKIPKVYIFVDQIVRAPSGKADYRWARDRAYQALGVES